MSSATTGSCGAAAFPALSTQQLADGVRTSSKTRNVVLQMVAVKSGASLRDFNNQEVMTVIGNGMMLYRDELFFDLKQIEVFLSRHRPDLLKLDLIKVTDVDLEIVEGTLILDDGTVPYEVFRQIRKLRRSMSQNQQTIETIMGQSTQYMKNQAKAVHDWAFKEQAAKSPIMFGVAPKPPPTYREVKERSAKLDAKAAEKKAKAEAKKKANDSLASAAASVAGMDITDSDDDDDAEGSESEHEDVVEGNACYAPSGVMVASEVLRRDNIYQVDTHTKQFV